MSWANIRAIAFDLDGTLVDSVPDLAAATNATLSTLGLSEVSELQVRSWVGNGAKVLVQRALSFVKADLLHSPQFDELHQQAMPIFMAKYEIYLNQHSQLYPDVVETLTALKQAGYILAVVTNKPHRFAVPLLAAFGLTDFFPDVLGGDSLLKMKPDPMPLQHLLQQWQISSDQMLMVGDSKNDILAAKSAGVMSIGLTYGYNYGDDIGLNKPNAVCDHFSQIKQYLTC